MQVHQLLQPVVAIDHPAIKIIQVRGREAPAIQWHQRTQLRRNNRNDIQNHPVGFIPTLAESFNNFQTLGILEPLLQRGLILHLLPQFAGETLDIHSLKKFLNCLRAHHGLEARGTILLVEFPVLGLVFDDFVVFYRRVTRLHHNVSLEIENRFEITQGDVKQVTDAAGKALEEPHVRAGRSQLYVP